MNFYVDCEFLEDGVTIELISIGVVAGNGATFYRQNIEMPTPENMTPWLRENVLPLLSPMEVSRHDSVWRTHSDIASDLLEFVTEHCRASDSEPVFWGDWASYDWVAVCQLYGPMIALPKGWPYFIWDTEQERKRWANDPEDTEWPPSEYLKLPDFHAANGFPEHHALNDAKVCFMRWAYLSLLPETRGTEVIPIPDKYEDIVAMIEEYGMVGMI